jgi:hypothetical protein
MCAHDVSLKPRRPAKSVHNEGEQMTKKERLSHFDDLEASIVRWRLGTDEEFLLKARRIAILEPLERRAEAEREAVSYVSYQGPHRRLVVDLLLLCADEPWNAWHPATRVTFLSSGRAVWVDAELDELDARRVRERWTTLKEGAQRLAWFGAGRCISCGVRLAADRFRGRAHPTHCSAHERLSGAIRESHKGEIREALDAATGQRRRRRASRRAA